LQLQQISQLPKQMDIAGTLPGVEYKYLCVIGSRINSSYGKAVCKTIIEGLAGYPIVIVSGLAIGIDSLAHEAALSVGLKTVAFPGSGLSMKVLYPVSRRNLAERIVEAGGAIISPFPYERDGTLWTFPSRNRLMAGISHAVLIIEAGPGSGTLLTAGNANEFGRDIFAVPGSIYSELSYGPHMLIRHGAAIIHSAADVLRELGFDSAERSQKVLNNLSLSEQEKIIVAELQISSQNTDYLLQKTGISPTALNICISRLEIEGVIVSENGLFRMNL